MNYNNYGAAADGSDSERATEVPSNVEFQIQIVVSPAEERRCGAEVTVTATTPSRLMTNRRLPPLLTASGSRDSSPSGSRNSATSSPSSRTSRSPYHQFCVPYQGLTAPGRPAVTRRAPRVVPPLTFGQKQQPENRQTPGTSSVGVNGNGRMVLKSTSYDNLQELSDEQVGGYLRDNPDFLEQFVMEEVELEQLERWMIRRMQRAKTRTEPNGKIGRKTSLSRWKFCVHADKRKMLQELTQSLHLRPNKANVLWELGTCISSAVNADGFRLYLLDNSTQQLRRYDGNVSEEVDLPNGYVQDICTGTTLPAYVSQTREAVRTSSPENDPRFPLGSGSPDEPWEHFLVLPIIQSDGEQRAVLELLRRAGASPFYEEDEEIVNSYLVWGGIAMHYAELYHNMDKQRRLNDFLLTVVKSIFQDMVSMDTLIMKVMNFAQRLVDADRASLFLLDNRSNELYARLFDMGTSNDDEPPKLEKEIRFGLGTGIAGTVAKTGEVQNITDAYSDPRFNRSVDQLTGYRTRTILCMPIYIRSSVIGVVQMVNKRSGVFTKEDEASFETFAVYCGLALHHAKLYDKIRRSEQKYKVALEVLSYHNSCQEDEVRMLKMEGVPDDMERVLTYEMNPMSLSDQEKVRYTIAMFVDLFGLSRFESESLIRFSLTVKRNYRRVPYHNWGHGFAVANSMYTILKHSQEIFKPMERLALYIGSLCHDLDHRGKNNKFMLDSESPLAAVYSTSTMEHHHFNQTITILQQEGHNIFQKLGSHEYKQVLGLIKHCILATDLALFFPNKARLGQMAKDDSFSWDDPDHRMLLETIAMTGADLCASTKPWGVQSETVRVIFEEFYEQGDEERAAGRTPMPMMDRYLADQQSLTQGDAEKEAGRVPIPMMDRNKKEEQANMQVGFITGICIPCYELLGKFLPGTQPMLDGCKRNLERWQQIASEQRAISEAQKKEEEEEKVIAEAEAKEKAAAGAKEVPPPTLEVVTAANEEEEDDDEGVGEKVELDPEVVLEDDEDDFVVREIGST